MLRAKKQLDQSCWLFLKHILRAEIKNNKVTSVDLSTQVILLFLIYGRNIQGLITAWAIRAIARGPQISRALKLFIKKNHFYPCQYVYIF